MTIYLDNHATTRVDPAVISTMLPLMESEYANPGSVTHEAGRHVADRVAQSIDSIARHFNADASEIIITSGATESNNLAVFGVALHPKQTRRQVISVVTEHRALLDPLARLEKLGFEIVRLPVYPNSHPLAGQIDLEQLENALSEKTALVSVMLANNEIGTIQPIRSIAELCRRFAVPFHTDATQAVGRLKIDVQSLGVDLLSFSAHKFYGPKGVGGLYVRQSPWSVRLQPQILGGGQQSNLRSGTLNSLGIVGMAKALEICEQRMQSDAQIQFQWRELLWRRLKEQISELSLNGPMWTEPLEDWPNRLVNNLNVCFPKVDGQSLMLAVPDLAVSSGSACTSAEPHPSHVLLAIGLSPDQTRASLRFGIGRFNTESEMVQTADWIAQAHAKLASFAA